MFRVKIVSVMYNNNNKNTITATTNYYYYYYYYLIHYLLKYNWLFSTMDSSIRVMSWLCTFGGQDY